MNLNLLSTNIYKLSFISLDVGSLYHIDIMRIYLSSDQKEEKRKKNVILIKYLEISKI